MSAVARRLDRSADFQKGPQGRRGPAQRKDRKVKSALAYAKDRWPVFPIWPGGKNPLTRRGLQDATTDTAVIQRWWGRWPQANIGLAVPRGYVVLDVDSEDALQSLKHQDLGLPSTATSKTARGWHFWYAVGGRVLKNCVGILPGVDIRASGGYVIVPPSVHPSGVIYHWEVVLDRSAISECPEWILELASNGSRHRLGRSAEDWLEVIARPVTQGRRNQTLAEVSGLLFRRLPAKVAAELAYCWAQVKLSPPLPEREVRRTIDSIAGRELRRRGGSV